jgi:hypothetical protein
MTIEQLLKADKDLPRMLGELLHGEHKEGESGFCENCYLFMTDENLQKNPTCDIELFPANAFKWRDWAVEKYGAVIYKDALIDIYCDEVGMLDSERGTLEECLEYFDKYIIWLTVKAQPKHYLLAAAACKLRGESDEK